MKNAYSHVLSSSTFEERLFEIKKAFQQRDYVGANWEPSFDLLISSAVFQPENLSTYLVNYVPSRALAYYHIFAQHPDLLKVIRRKKIR